MRKIILLFLFIFFNFLYAIPKSVSVIYNGMVFVLQNITGPYDTSKDCDYNWGNEVFFNGYSYKYASMYQFLSNDGDKDLNYDCAVYIAQDKKICGYLYEMSVADFDYCRPSKHPGASWSKVLNAWLNIDGSVQCPSNQYYDKNQSKCLDIPSCPSGMIFNENNAQCVCPSGTHFNNTQEKCMPDCPDQPTLEKQAIQKCGSLNFAKKISCNTDTGQVYIECMSCSEIMQAQYDLCAKNNAEVVDGLSCTTNSDGSNVVNFNNISLSNCKSCDNNITSSNNNSGDVNNTGVTNTSNNNSGDVNNTGVTSTSNNDNSSNINTSNNDNSSDTNSSNNVSFPKCPSDLCYRYQNPSVGDNWVASGNCWIWSNAPKGCPNKICFNGGKCSVPGSGNTASNSDNSGNSGSNLNLDLSPITSRLDTTNNKLDNIDKDLNDIKDLKPDGNFTPAGYQDDNTSFFSLSTFFDNTKKTLSDLKDNVEKLQDLIKNPKKVTLFNSGSYSCPITVIVYNRKLTADICQFVAPYRSILFLFFTLFFSFSVFIVFLKIIIKGDS